MLGPLRRVAVRVSRAHARTMAAAAGGGGGGGGGGGAKLWGGRFTGKTDPLMEKFNNSIGFDQRFWRVDIRGSIEYAKALARAGILSKDEAAAIEGGLLQVCVGEANPLAGEAYPCGAS
jgi:hypothetical protein